MEYKFIDIKVWKTFGISMAGFGVFGLVCYAIGPISILLFPACAISMVIALAINGKI